MKFVNAQGLDEAGIDENGVFKVRLGGRLEGEDTVVEGREGMGMRRVWSYGRWIRLRVRG